MPDTSKLNETSQVPSQRETLSRKADPLKLANLLDEWMRGDEAEQRETFAVLRHFLDEDRPAGYKLFS